MIIVVVVVVVVVVVTATMTIVIMTSVIISIAPVAVVFVLTAALELNEESIVLPQRNDLFKGGNIPFEFLLLRDLGPVHLYLGRGDSFVITGTVPYAENGLPVRLTTLERVFVYCWLALKTLVSLRSKEGLIN